LKNIRQAKPTARLRRARHLFGLALLIILAEACGVSTPLIGRWQSGDMPGALIVYEDATVSVFGMRCRWAKADQRAIRIESCFSDAGAKSNPLFSIQLTADFRLTSDHNHATLSVGFLEIPFQRIP
jgi:hypothetical protein